MKSTYLADHNQVDTAQPTNNGQVVLQRQCACGQRTAAGGECAKCRKKRLSLQRHAVNRAGPTAAPPIVHEVLRSPGQRLDSNVRSYMESRFGHDFSGVRVHTDAKAGESAHMVNAQAFTAGRDVVFGRGHYAPQTENGRILLAHELTHVLQQSSHRSQQSAQSSLKISTPSDPAEREAERIAKTINQDSRILKPQNGTGTDGLSQIAPISVQSFPNAMIMRRWDQPGASDCTDIPQDRWLSKVVVEQETPQSVTLHWNNGHLESGICSTGKGHCCVDSSTPDGTACSAGGSGRSGSNCTPITSATGYRIRDRHLVHNGWKFWNTFVRNRGIALHQHHTVTGKPLSHGCVRLNEETARHIFCGARRHQTQVQVRGFARPSCSDSNLINEWRKDFRSAAENPSDGETPRARQIIRSNRRTTRRMLRAAYGRSLTEAEFSSGLDTLDIPRCQATAAQPTAEERRLLPSTPADANTVTVPNQILVSSGFERFLVPFTRDLRGATNLQRVRRVVRRHGRKLWQEATTRANLSTANTDDRPLYWSRLQLARALRQWQPRFQLSAIQRESLLDLLEQSSRGMDTATFRNRPDEKKILISGFDPFGLNNNIRRGNPSGAAALALDGKTISAGGISAQIQAVIFPVRFADFNAGIVESFFRPFLASNNLVDMIMTISMGGSTEFEVEEFAGRRRSAGSSTGNLGQTGGGTQTSPTVPPGVQAGPEFLRTTLPAQPIRGGLGRTTPLAGETEVTEIPQGGTQAARRTSGPTSGSMAVAGSGGGYLSNEIFYQSSLLRTNLGATVPVGHLHTPSLKAPLDNSVAIQQFNSHRDAIVQQVEQILESTLPHL